MFKEYQRKPKRIRATEYAVTKNPVDDAKPIIDYINGNGGVAYFENGGIMIQTLEGAYKASPGWFICQGVEGEFWPVKPSIFHETNELVN